MKKNKLVKMDLTVYSDKLENGLEVYVVPKENVNGFYVTLSTKYGSVYDEFVPVGKNEMSKVPMGVAHFLEHKVFEQKDGIDPFTFYSERGCDANANTSNYKTTYLFSGTNFFSEGLNYLLDYVQEPYFTDENVEKEKGIIEQEINMYADNPYFKLYDGIIYNTFINHPIKYPIAGTVSSINKITKEDLYTCYNTFYNPANMFLTVTGNVDYKDVFALVKANQSDKKFDKIDDINIKNYDEPDSVVLDFKKELLDIQIPKVSIGYKISKGDIKLNINDFKTYLNILFNIKFGTTSVFNETLKEENLSTGDIDISLINTDKHVLVILMIETNNVGEVINRVENELKDLMINEDDFNRKKKIRKSASIFKSDSIYAINNKIMSNIINYNEIIYDEYKKIDELKFDVMKKVTKNIDLSNKTVYVIDKKDE